MWVTGGSEWTLRSLGGEWQFVAGTGRPVVALLGDWFTQRVCTINDFNRVYSQHWVLKLDSGDFGQQVRVAAEVKVALRQHPTRGKHLGLFRRHAHGDMSHCGRHESPLVNVFALINHLNLAFGIRKFNLRVADGHSLVAIPV